MLRYAVNDFLTTKCDDTIADIIDKKVSLLYDFHILIRKDKRQDARECYVRKLLNNCGNEHRMSIVLRDVLTDRVTLDKLLEQKGLM